MSLPKPSTIVVEGAKGSPHLKPLDTRDSCGECQSTKKDKGTCIHGPNFSSLLQILSCVTYTPPCLSGYASDLFNGNFE